MLIFVEIVKRFKSKNEKKDTVKYRKMRTCASACRGKMSVFVENKEMFSSKRCASVKTGNVVSVVLGEHYVSKAAVVWATHSQCQQSCHCELAQLTHYTYNPLPARR